MRVCVSGKGRFQSARLKANPIAPRRMAGAGIPRAERAPLIPPVPVFLGVFSALAAPLVAAGEVATWLDGVTVTDG